MQRPKIQIVEDESIIALDLKETLVSLDYEVIGIAGTGSQCLSDLEEDIPDLILMDINLKGDLNGIETAEIIHKGLDVPIIFVTAHSDNVLLENAKQVEPYAYILKPVSKKDLHSAIEIALYKFNTDKKLKESESMLLKAEEIAHVGTYKYNLKKNTIKWSKELLNIFQLDINNTERPLEDSLSLIHPDDLEKVNSAITALIKNKKPQKFEYRIFLPDNSTKYLLSMGEVVCEKNGNVVEIISTCQDITEQKHNEERIKHLNSLLKVIRNINQLIKNERDVDRLIQNACNCLIDTKDYSSAFIILFDDSFSYITASCAGFSSEYFSKIKSLNVSLPCVKKIAEQKDYAIIDDTYPVCSNCIMLEKEKNENKIFLDLAYGKKKYGILTVQMNSDFSSDEEEHSLLKELAVDIAFTLYSIEIERDRKSLITQLVHSEKLSAVGQLAAGLAHEFNNFLNVILGRTQIAMLDDSLDDVRDALKVIEKMTRRGSDLVKNLGAFARPSKPKLQMHDLIELLDDVIKFQKKQLSLEKIEIKKNYDYFKPVSLDRGQFEQVLLNLLINASHAIRPKGYGVITISLKACGDNVKIIFSDNGIGMDENTKAKIFDPFFTTKKTKSDSDITGSGLGLSVTRKIVEQHNGEISVSSEEGKGTIFTIKLPRAADKTISEDRTMPETPGPELADLKEKKIMVIDDEKEMIDLMSYLFKKNGFNNVLIKDSAIDAVSVFSSFNPDIVFLDLIMPDISGEDVFKQLKDIRNDIPIVFMTGKVSIDEEKYLKMGAYDFIHKPFDVRMIFDIIRDLKC